VFLPGWEEGVFPSQRALDEGGLASLEEERRLAYVAITRARRRCTILHAANRRIYGQWTSSIPSRFIEELPEEHIEAETTLTGGAIAVARQLERAGGPLRPCRPRPAAARRGPGWQRASADTRPKPAPAGSAAKPRADIAGARVFHDKFGYGTVRRKATSSDRG
jgi:DNA helicase II / ATP-dependent DNA helicase PcrA